MYNLCSVRNLVNCSTRRLLSAGINKVKKNIVQYSKWTKMSSEVSSHYADVNGVKIHYEKVGTGDCKLLLLPGALGCSRTDWGPQLEHLNRNELTVIAWDPRGYGKSRPPDRDYPHHFIKRDADDAKELMKVLEYDTYSLCGWSDGGITALMVAADNAAVHHLVVFGANCYVEQQETLGWDAVRDINNWSERMRKPFLELYGHEYFQKMWNEDLDAFVWYLNERNGDICKTEVEQIKCPTLIIHGDKDILVPSYHPEYLHKHIPKSRIYHFPDGKHNLHFKYYKEFNAMVENFVLGRDDSKI